MAEPLLNVVGVSKGFGAHQVLQDVKICIHSREIVGLIGPNGSGKSTLLDVISGFTAPDRGQVMLRDLDITTKPPHAIARQGLIRTFQLPSMPHRMTVRELLRVASADGSDSMRSFASTGTEEDPQSAQLLRDLALGPGRDQRASALSGGQRKLLSIAMALRANPAILCLDEPTAGVHSSLRTRIVDLLRTRNAAGVTILVIEHDMNFVRDLCDRCLVLDRGSLIADCHPSQLVNDSRVVEAYLGRTHEKWRVSA